MGNNGSSSKEEDKPESENDIKENVSETAGSLVEDGTMNEEIALVIDDEIDDAILCCICKKKTVEACVSVCGHQYCRICIERSLLCEKTCPECKNDLTPYLVVLCDSGATLKEIEVTTIFGTTFIQQGKIGLGSFHFEQDRCYISYSPEFAVRCLDDKTQIPMRKYFQNWNYDSENRTFTGVIEWPSPATFEGSSRWEYEMVFDEGLEHIESGNVRVFNVGGWLQSVEKFGEILLYRRLKSTIYGSVYVYTIAIPWLAIKFVSFLIWIMRLVGLPKWMPDDYVSESFYQSARIETLGLGSLHFSKNGSYIDYSKSPVVNEGIPPIVRFVRESYDEASRTFQGVADFKTFLGQYRLVFDEGLEKIVEGEQKLFAIVKPQSGGGDVFAEKYQTTVLQDQLVFMREDPYGFEDPKALRFRLVLPWQKAI